MKKNSYELKTIEFEGDSLEFLSMQDTCASIFQNKSNEVLLVKQYRPIFNDYFLELPGGSKENNESIEQAAIREFSEETGYLPQTTRFILSVILSIGSSTEKVHIFEISSLQENSKSSPESGIEQVWIKTSEIDQMIKNGIIVDAKTIIALQNLLLSKKHS